MPSSHSQASREPRNRSKHRSENLKKLSAKSAETTSYSARNWSRIAMRRRTCREADPTPISTRVECLDAPEWRIRETRSMRRRKRKKNRQRLALEMRRRRETSRGRRRWSVAVYVGYGYGESALFRLGRFRKCKMEYLKGSKCYILKCLETVMEQLLKCREC